MMPEPLAGDDAGVAGRLGALQRLPHVGEPPAADRHTDAARQLQLAGPFRVRGDADDVLDVDEVAAVRARERTASAPFQLCDPAGEDVTCAS